MFERRLPVTFGVSLLLLIAGAFLFSNTGEKTNDGLRRRLMGDPKTVSLKDALPVIASELLHAAIDVNPSAEPESYWCSEPKLDPLPYYECNPDDIVYRIPLVGGMTNAIKLVLLGAITAFEENRCFFVDEGEAHLNNFDRTDYYENGFISHYFERIGISEKDPIVLKAHLEGRTRTLTWREVWEPTRNRRMFDQLTTLPALGYHNMPGHELKTIMMQRMWRPLPGARESTCKRYYQMLGRQDFLAMSVRRGDKTTENFDFIPMSSYLEAADTAIQDRFEGVPPIIFVATDDCSVLSTLRESRPTWRFISECDKHHQEGFDLRDMAQWTNEDYDEHFGKFFVELFAMAHAKYFIGIGYTNVSWFVYFMRGGKMENFELLDAKQGTLQVLQNW
jgi:hypothetical protein